MKVIKNKRGMVIGVISEDLEQTKRLSNLNVQNIIEKLVSLLNLKGKEKV